MPSVILLSPQNVETTVTTAVEFNEYVFGYGFRPKIGTIEANFAALLVGGVAPNPDPNAVVRLGDLSAAGSAARVALGAAFDASVRSAAYIDFTTKADGAAPTVLDTGQTVTSLIPTTGKAPVIVGGRLIHGTLPATSLAYADYFQAQLGGLGKRIGAEWVQPAGADDGNGVTCVALWASVYVANGTLVPSAKCHLTFTPGTGATGAWKYWVCDSLGHLFVVKQGTYTNPAADGVTRWVTDAVFDDEAGIAYVYLPDGQLITVSDAEIAAACTALGYAVVKLKDLGGAVAMIEHFANSGGNTATYPEFTSMWAETALAVRATRTVNPRVLAKALTAVKAAIPAPAVYALYAPTTALTAATTTSASNVDATNAKVVGTYGPTGRILFEVDSYYEFTGTDTVFQRFVVGAATTTPRVAVIGTTGQKFSVHHTAEITGGTPGLTANCFLQHFCLTGGLATLKAGGTGAGTIPPLVIKATPL